jgi:hypothetical protein
MPENSEVNRRKVLKGAGAAAATGILTDPASACEQNDYEEALEEAAEPYRSPETVEKLVNRERKFLSALSEEGVLESSTIEINELASGPEYLDSTSAARVWGLDYPGGVAAAHVTIRRETPSGKQLTIALNPELDSPVRAIVKPEKNPEERVPATVYRARPDAAEIEKESKTVVPKPAKDDGANTSTASTSDVSTSGTAVEICRNRSGTCSGAKCYGWETDCCGDNCCDLIECNGNVCCGGCCCCEDQGWCCEVCGDYECENGTLCSDPDYDCTECVPGTGCCSDGEGCPHPNCNCS